jgi:hypothetical protein
VWSGRPEAATIVSFYPESLMHVDAKMSHPVVHSDGKFTFPDYTEFSPGDLICFRPGHGGKNVGCVIAVFFDENDMWRKVTVLW